jgi:hypothetical protein
MFGYEEINLHLIYSSLYFILAIILIAAYAYYVYRYTIPQVSRFKRITLVTLRTLALIAILFIFFEPILSFTKKITLEPVNLVFIDNSRSIKIDDGTDRINTITEISIDLFSNPISANDEVYLFGKAVRAISEDSLDMLDFDDAVTNISQVFSSIKKEEKNYSTISLITDGVVTAGSNSIYAAQNLGLPVFTFGIGDTTQRKDISIKRLLYNRLLYAQTPSTIEVTLQHNGLSGKNTTISLYENNVLVEQKKIILNKPGIQKEEFIYTPEVAGDKKLSVVVSELSEEFTSANNRKVFYINVLSNKVKVLLLGGKPSADLTFIKNALRTDENFNVMSLAQINSDKLSESNFSEMIDSADIFFLIGFPSRNSSPELVSKVVEKILNDKIPFFLLFSSDVDVRKLTELQTEIPINIQSGFRDVLEVQPQIFSDQKNNSIIQNNALNPIEAWNDLPPVFHPAVNLIPKPESNVIAKIKVNNKVINSPLIVSRSFSGRRSIAVLAGSIWKWKLQTSRKDYDLFNSFILNSVKWLNASDENKRVNITTLKKNYSSGELIEFEAQVYDESINPVADAELKLEIISEDDTYQLDLQSVSSGLYEGSIRLNKKGDFIYVGKALLEGKKLGADQGLFNVGDLDIEMVDPRMNFELLNLLANETNGEFADANNYEQLFQKIRMVNEKSVRDKIITSDITLWSDEWLMVIAIFLFSLEWFLRKRAGML